MKFLRRIEMRALFLTVVIGLLSAVCVAQSVHPIIEVPNPPNTPAQQAKHYVVLVSLDGFRFDYATKYQAKHLLAMAARGASTPDGMIPSFPTVTFPNHYTLATGLYPGHHGIVSDSFYDPTTKRQYNYRIPADVRDGSWYGGVPLWILAEQQGMRSAPLFWVGSEAEIQGKRPSYYANYDGNFSDEKRVDQVLAWLRLPPEQRPHFLTVYSSIVDSVSHKHISDSQEVAEAVKHVDDIVGRLEEGLAQLHLPVDVIVVSDHGQTATKSGWNHLDQFADLSHFEFAGGVVSTLLYPDSGDAAEKAYESLRGSSDKFNVYRRAKAPTHLHLADNPRFGDPIIVATGPFYFRAREAAGFGDPPNMDPGQHGYDVQVIPDMKAIFYAEGPDIREGVRVKSFENVNVYPLVAKILGLRIGKNDGKIRVLQGILKKN